ncbi:hypothetical protein RUM44_001138 [Polyplax serrata]|uniref:Uncharacterized protein n=1 Tax=Polyplax serrata TaxID=468196 RepID=A0ABR1B9P7_POLSC
MTQSEIEGHVTGPKSYAFVKCYPSKKWKEVERQADVERRNLQAPLQVDTHASVAPTVEDSGGGVLPGGVYLGTPSPDPPSKKTIAGDNPGGTESKANGVPGVRPSALARCTSRAAGWTKAEPGRTSAKTKTTQKERKCLESE